jgi:hypothetical protein
VKRGQGGCLPALKDQRDLRKQRLFRAILRLVLVIGALGVASAIYIIVDLISPFSGVFVVSNAPLVDVLKAVESAVEPGGGHR